MDGGPTASQSAYPDALPARHALHWYALEGVLGQGGFGITYLARDTNLDQTVAIKEYLPVDVATRRADTTVRPRSDEQAERYRWGLDRFIQEARTLARFDHPNIVRVLSVFEHNGTAYMVMRFEKGENFGALLERRRTLPEPELMRVLLPILDGLELVHGAGFIHRDIKPDNIHIRADGSPVLLDFGSARHALGNARTVTILVAPGYAPFEQYYASNEDQGPWTDLYSLGATCYRAITGVAPLDAIARSKGILGSTRELLVPASAIGAGRYSVGFLKAVDHALAFAEKDRPATIAQWRAELAGFPAAAAASTPAPPAAAAGTAPTSQPPVMGPVMRGAIFVAIALLGGAVGAWFMTRPAPQQPAVQNAVFTDAQKAAAEKAAAERAAAERAAAEKVEAAKVAAQPALDRAAAEEAAREKAAATTPAVPPKTRAPAPPAKPAPTAVAAARPSPSPASDSGAAPAEPPKPAPPESDAARFDRFRALALRGDPEAALRLGEMYEAGRGTTSPSANWAYVWYSVAAARGVSSAQAPRAEIARRLQTKEIEQADKLARTLTQPDR